MKQTLIIIFLGIVNFTMASSCSNKIMKNKESCDSIFVKEIEAVFLNNIFETERNTFDFTNKAIGFLTGSSGSRKGNKEDYLDMHKRHSMDAGFASDKGTLYIFNVLEKEQSGGFDAAIVYWCKIALPTETVIKRLRK